MISESMSMRWMVLAVFVLGLLGTGGELLFLGHTAGMNQLIPIVLLVMSLLVLAWHTLERKSASIRTFQITMLLFVAAGILGTGFHYWANQEFEPEGHVGGRAGSRAGCDGPVGTARPDLHISSSGTVAGI
jgi:hypothetical protein